MMGERSNELETLLTDLSSEKQRIESLRNDLEKQHNEVTQLRVSLDKEIQSIRLEERKMLGEIKDSLLAESAELQKQIHQAASALRKTKTREQIEHAKRVLSRTQENLNNQRWRPNTVKSNAAGAQVTIESVSVGDRVKFLDRDLEGTVLSIGKKEKQLEVQAGNAKLTVGIEDITSIKPPAEITKSKFSGRLTRRSKTATSLELDLRGKRASEVQGIMDNYLNDAFLGNFSQVRIIHGYGTGAVRQIVRELLACHPLVSSFTPGAGGEGGDGVTIVTLLSHTINE
jgi:DNA mismatch repair protein MutS2